MSYFSRQVFRRRRIELPQGGTWMERKQKKREPRVFDLPADVVAGLPRLEMVGSRQLYLEHHTGILSYCEERIDVNTGTGVLSIRGEHLSLVAMTAGELRIGGRIGSLEWVR